MLKNDCNITCERKIDEAVFLLRQAKSVLFITGAGLSADSGLPTYRGLGGLYDGQTTEEGLPIEMVLAGEMLATRPEITWKYLSQIEGNCRKTTFNRGHEVMALFEQEIPRVWILTQNIDGFHRKAGSKNVIEIHGNLHDIFCPHCLWKKKINDFGEIDIPPLCPRCNTIARPEVVFFGEMLPVDKLQLFYEQLEQGFDLYFSVGTTSVFPYIRQPMMDAKYRGKPTIEINPGTTEISDSVDVKLLLKAASALDEIWKRYKDKK